ncbi:SWEET14 [Symbiodinium natans]|uniref:SWEET14 protein n=1 Tax=Symbiodinium natans TaxID=878477 RepID=A0A812UQ76_9DINO|nr:SWEET14 [Symbiodinium natans]
MPPSTLANAIAASEVAENRAGLECFTDKERTSEFCEATDPAGNLESNSSAGHKEYQDRLRTIALRKVGRVVLTEGFEKAEIAEVHDYLRTDFWRDIEIIRGFGKGQRIYEDALTSMEWVQPMADGREFKNGGGYRLKYDKEGRMRPQGNQNAKDGVIPGKLPELDKLMQRVMVEQGIDDRVLKRPGLLWYPDGNADAIVHRHEAWTALMSFGAPRILTIDGQPVLLRDGDLIVFGTQRHGVPKMCSEGSSFGDYGGRMSVVMFFMPTGQQATGAAPWKAIHDSGPSRKAGVSGVGCVDIDIYRL